jgi:DNA-binding response OmpR family regulator
MECQNDTPAVLVVDDDPDILAALHDLLEHEGYQVTCASTCGDALAEATASPYDAVLLDIGLPDGDGLSVLDLLREQHPSLPVIILTAFGSPEYRARSLSHGAFSCVNKPYDQDALRGLLRRAIRAHASIDTIPSSTPASPSPDS